VDGWLAAVAGMSVCDGEEKTERAARRAPF